MSLALVSLLSATLRVSVRTRSVSSRSRQSIPHSVQFCALPLCAAASRAKRLGLPHCPRATCNPKKVQATNNYSLLEHCAHIDATGSVSNNWVPTGITISGEKARNLIHRHRTPKCLRNYSSPHRPMTNPHATSSTSICYRFREPYSKPTTTSHVSLQALCSFVESCRETK